MDLLGGSFGAAGIVCATGSYLKEPIIRGLKGFFQAKFKKALCSRRNFKNVNQLYSRQRLISRRSRDIKLNALRQINLQETAARTSTPLDEVMKFCEVQENVKFSVALPVWKQESLTKIAEGAFGEIYSVRAADGSHRILKCMPVNGQHPHMQSPNVSLKTVLPEIVCSTLLSKLNNGYLNYATANFPEVFRVCIVKDEFPPSVVKTWEDYKTSRELDEPPSHPNPAAYDENQQFVTIESSFCGDQLTIKAVQNAWVGASIITQLTSALAVAEEAFHFEHRDLHKNNLLIRSTEVESLKYSMQDCQFSVLTVGKQLFVIDFTMSRISQNGKVYCVDVDPLEDEDDDDSRENKWLNFKNLYGMMSEMFTNSENHYLFVLDEGGIFFLSVHSCAGAGAYGNDFNKGDWSKFNPKSNILWIKYAIETIIFCLERNQPHLKKLNAEARGGNQMEAMEYIRFWNDTVLDSNSAKEFLQGSLLTGNPLVHIYGK